MRSITKKILIMANFFLVVGFLNMECLSETNKNSIINLFCLESFKEEMFKANIIYDDTIAQKTCNCYLDEFSKSKSHQKAINKCKLETQEKFNLELNIQ